MKALFRYAGFIAVLIFPGYAPAAFAAGTVACPVPHKLSECIKRVADAGGGTVLLGNGTWFQDSSLLLSSNVALEGAGPGTVITWSPAVRRSINAPLLYATSASHVTIKDVKLVGTIDPRADSQDLRNNQIGLFFNCSGDPTAGEKTGCSDITLQNVEVENSSDGIHIKGASRVTAIDLKLHNNGNTEKDYFHNIYLRRVADVRLIQTGKNSGGFYANPRGHGIRGSHLINVYMSNLDVYNNADYGIHMDTVFNVRLHNMHVYHNCLSGKPGCQQIKCFGPQCDIHLNAPAEDAGNR
ncbi:right-handed parallel beta-helix repeat-containing protein [Rahnella sp. C60]|uniref:right-handed parallel beta-helix repeat-containing protein n=1 Tax=Rahnella perminowiae TaxID=2816244 RepID=UPI001C277828|nr:right-handed parallel beta-helix repeat-containing protein [Rahnella perminowiae]MBU9817971.1 right-handed parallel beta-helix repeat-containing protein [Rahnella perminowiae]